jgi:hypothetical protein
VIGGNKEGMNTRLGGKEEGTQIMKHTPHANILFLVLCTPQKSYFWQKPLLEFPY